MSEQSIGDLWEVVSHTRGSARGGAQALNWCLTAINGFSDLIARGEGDPGDEHEIERAEERLRAWSAQLVADGVLDEPTRERLVSGTREERVDVTKELWNRGCPCERCRPLDEATSSPFVERLLRGTGSDT